MIIPFKGNKITVDTSLLDKINEKLFKFYGVTQKTKGEVIKVTSIHGKLIECQVRFHVPKAAPARVKQLKNVKNPKAVFAFYQKALYDGVLRAVYKGKKHPLTSIFQ